MANENNKNVLFILRVHTRNADNHAPTATWGSGWQVVEWPGNDVRALGCWHDFLWIHSCPCCSWHNINCRSRLAVMTCVRHEGDWPSKHPVLRVTDHRSIWLWRWLIIVVFSFEGDWSSLVFSFAFIQIWFLRWKWPLLLMFSVVHFIMAVTTGTIILVPYPWVKSQCKMSGLHLWCLHCCHKSYYCAVSYQL